MKDIVISKYPKGLLSQKEIEEILNTLKDARKNNKIPKLSYQYHKETKLDRIISLGIATGEVLIVTPREGNTVDLKNKLDVVLKGKFGNKYKAESDAPLFGNYIHN